MKELRGISMLETDKSYGVKLFIISPMDWEDLKIIVEAVQAKGYKATFNDNGSVTLEKN